MGNAQGIERRIHDEASHYEGDLCFVSFGTGGCWGTQPANTDQRGLNPIEGMNKQQAVDRVRAQTLRRKMKRPCLVSCSLGNCMAAKRVRGDDDDIHDAEDDAHHRGRSDQGQSIFSCGFARIGCLTPAWLNPAPPPVEADEEQKRRERQVETDVALLKARQASKHNQQQQQRKLAKKAKKRASGGDVKISSPHLETFRRTTDEFISAHLALCPDPRARVKLDSGEGARVVSLEASAPPPPSTDGPWEQQHNEDSEIASLPSPCSPPPPPVPVEARADGRGRLQAPAAEKDALPAPRHLPPPPPPPSSSP